MLQQYWAMYSPLNSAVKATMPLYTPFLLPFGKALSFYLIITKLSFKTSLRCCFFYVVSILAPWDQSLSYPMTTPKAYNVSHKYFSIALVCNDSFPYLHWRQSYDSPLGHSAQAPNRCSINVDLTGLSVKGVSTNSIMPNVSGQETSVFSILLKDTYSWAKQKLTKHYRCFWKEDVAYIKLQYILTIAAVSLRFLDIPLFRATAE